jgi:ferric-chelate reductase
MSTIPYNLQYFVEKERNTKFGWLSFGLSLLSLFAYGVVFHWSQIYLRRFKGRFRWYFKLHRTWEFFNSSIPIRVPKFIISNGRLYFQPSLLILLFGYLAINGSFMFVETIDLDYEPRFYIVGKRIGRIASSNFPVLYLFACKNDPIPFITGLPHDKVNVMHRWMGRSIWCMVLTHLTISILYWLRLDFQIMLQIPPQIFGMIAFGSMTILTWGSLRIFRRLSYEFFLFNHGLSAGIMMLFALFHNGNSRAYVILAIHTVVLDRITSFVRAFVNRKLSPTKSIAELTVLDEEGTAEVRLPLSKFKYQKWYMPNIGTWSVGQHVYLRVGAVRKIQWHPFTIASMPESEEVRLVIRPHTGFSKAIGETIKKKQEEEGEESQVVKLLSLIHGPYGGRFVPLTTFDSSIFISGGTGSSFTMPVALDLAKTIRKRDEEQDYVHRPKNTVIRVVWYITSKSALQWYSELVKQLVANGAQVDIFVTREEKPVIIEEGDEKKFEDIMRTDSLSSDSSYSLRYERTSIREVIREEAQQIEKSMSMAVLGCGPASLTGEVQLECQKCRRHGTDVYTYIEKYTV